MLEFSSALFSIQISSLVDLLIILIVLLEVKVSSLLELVFEILLEELLDIRSLNHSSSHSLGSVPLVHPLVGSSSGIIVLRNLLVIYSIILILI